MKIGFLDRTQANWTAGASYTRSMVHALAGGDVPVHVVGGRSSSLGRLPEGVREIRSESELPSYLDLKKLVESHGLDVLLPVTEALPPDTPCALVGWIPDFQHRHLPEYFGADELAQRDRYFGYLVDNCDGMMFSSEAVLADFRAFYPAYAGRSVCAHFPSSFAYDPAAGAGDPRWVREKYALPAGFVLVANQFWKHKNHRLVVEAVAQARRVQPGVHVVMVGVPADSRDPRNRHLSELFRRLSAEKLSAHLSVLGEVPLEDLVALMRCAIEVVQPSRFEGWNTTVEDALALGKRVACSDLATHREQAPGAFFFPLDDAEPLARHFEGIDWTQDGWSGSEPEQASLEAERRRSEVWARGLIEFCRLVVADRGRRDGRRAGWTGHDPAEELKRHPLLYIDHLAEQNEGLRQRKLALEENVRTLRDGQTALKEARQTERGVLRGKLAAETKKAEALARELWAERSKPLRARLAEEWNRRLGRPKPARPEKEI